MPARTRIAKLYRVTSQGRTLHFTTPAMTKQRSAVDFIDPSKVPEFEGQEAWFEVECVRGGSRIAKVVRQVDGPQAPTDRPWW